MTASPLIIPVARFFTVSGGSALAGGQVYTYAAGTNTPKASYTDFGGLTPNANPVILDSSGQAGIWLNGNYKINVLDSTGVQQANYPVDNVSSISTGSVSEYAVTTGSANNYILTPTPPIVQYTAGQRFNIKINATNTGPSTINVSGLGNISLVINGATALPANALQIGVIYEIEYDGTNFQVSNPSIITGKLINEVHGADVASVTTVDLTNTTGNFVNITGTTTITAITLPNGYERVCRFTGILTLTNGASLVLPGAANITTAAGDIAVFRGDASNVVYCTSYERIASNVSTLTPGVAANNLVQLNGSSQLPAVSGVNLTGLTIGQISGLPLTKIFTSAAQTITDGGTVTLTHGLGKAPLLASVFMTCTTNNLGYTAGQTFFINPAGDQTTASSGNSLVFTSTTVVVRFGSAGQQPTNPTSGVGGTGVSADYAMTFTFLA